MVSFMTLYGFLAYCLNEPRNLQTGKFSKPNSPWRSPEAAETLPAFTDKPENPSQPALTLRRGVLGTLTGCIPHHHSRSFFWPHHLPGPAVSHIRVFVATGTRIQAQSRLSRTPASFYPSHIKKTLVGLAHS